MTTRPADGIQAERVPPVRFVHPAHERSTGLRWMHDLTGPVALAPSRTAPGGQIGRVSVAFVHSTNSLDAQTRP